MAVPRTPAPEDSPPAARTPDRATTGPPHLQMAGPFTDQALWARVISHARCADGTHDPEQWFPVSVQIEKARHEAAAAIAVCAICPVRSNSPSSIGRQADPMAKPARAPERSVV